MCKKSKLLIPLISIIVVAFFNVQTGLGAASQRKCERYYKEFTKGERGPDKAVSECEELAENGKPEAQLVLGKLYMHPENPDQDFDLSIEYLETCSNQSRDKETRDECRKELKNALAAKEGGGSRNASGAGAALQASKSGSTPAGGTKGPKKRIAVLEFEDKVTKRWWGSANIADRITEMVITELVNSNMFIVVERGAIDNVIREQDFGSSGRVREGTEAKIGNILGAQVLVKGAVTEFSQKESGGAGGIAIKGILVGGKTSTGHVAIDLRLIDSTTGQILQSHRAEGKIKDTGLVAGAALSGVAFGGTSFKKTSLGKATREAVTKAKQFIVGKMESQPWSSKIIKVDSNRVYITGGADMNIGNGLHLDVYSLGEELVDPDTGITLGQTMSRAGAVRVIQVESKFSIANIVDGGNFKRGDLVKMIR